MKGVLCLEANIVYHMQCGTVSTTLSLHLNIEEKYFTVKKRFEIGKVLRKLYEFEQVNIVEVEVCPDHWYLLSNYGAFVLLKSKKYSYA